eukprot:5565716-Prymnesium_polylepis.2
MLEEKRRRDVRRPQVLRVVHACASAAGAMRGAMRRGREERRREQGETAGGRGPSCMNVCV